MLETFRLIEDDKTGKKTKTRYQFCPKCGLVVIEAATPRVLTWNQTHGMCFLCYYKQKKWWKSAKEQLFTGFISSEHWYGPPVFLKVGWSFAPMIQWAKIILSSYKINDVLKSLGYSERQIKTTKQYYGG